MNSSGPIAVVGATGRQGSATVNALLDRGLPVGGLTRHVDSDAAKGLARLGAEVVEADLADPASIRRAFVRCGGRVRHHRLQGIRRRGRDRPGQSHR